MKSFVPSVFLLLATLSASAVAGGSWLGSDATTTDEKKFPVPGENPLFFCADPADYLLNVEQANLTPNPPKAGRNLTIAASGILREEVDKGAKVAVSVKYGLIRILNQEIDLCDQAGAVDLSCPVKEGPLTVHKDVALPEEIPPGTYNVLANVFDKDGKTLTCFTTSIAFHMGSLFGQSDEQMDL